MKLRVIPEPSEEGGYTVFVPGLPGCISEGDTQRRCITEYQGSYPPLPGTNRR